MSTAADLRDLERRPRRYWHVDGIPELVMGLVWLVWGGALLLEEALPREGAGAAAYRMFVPAVLVLSGFAANWAIARLKARLTYPRTGYIAYREPGRRARVLVALVVMGAAAALAALIVSGRAAGVERSAGPALGVILSLAFVVASVRQKAPHLLALSGVALALGLAFAALGLGWAAANWLFVGLGVSASAIGAWRLRRYLRRHPEEARA